MLRYLKGLTAGIIIGSFATIIWEAYMTSIGSSWMEKTVEYWKSV